MSNKAFLEKRVLDLEKECADAQARLADVREKLDRADARKKADPTQRDRWNGVIENLERDMAKAKAVIAHCEAEISEKRKKIAELPAEESPQAPSAAAESDLEDAEDDLNKVLDDLHQLLEPEDDVKRLLEMPPSELVNVSDEELSALQDYELRAARARRKLGEENAPKLLTPGERRKQEKLRLALEKLRVDNFYALTLDDMTVISEAYVTLNKIPRRTAQEEEMRFLIGGAIYSFEILYKYMQRWWKKAEGKTP
ncbi:MAG: hypothetical protein AMXMBFR84_22170 [Candidatus Hydrogenedentota bacterium]